MFKGAWKDAGGDFTKLITAALSTSDFPACEVSGKVQTKSFSALFDGRIGPIGRIHVDPPVVRADPELRIRRIGKAPIVPSNKCIASSNKCLTSSNKKLVETIS